MFNERELKLKEESEELFRKYKETCKSEDMGYNSGERIKSLIPTAQKEIQ